jgi:hypothetical protein
MQSKWARLGSTSSIQNNALIWWITHCQHRLKVGTGGGLHYYILLYTIIYYYILLYIIIYYYILSKIIIYYYISLYIMIYCYLCIYIYYNKIEIDYILNIMLQIYICIYRLLLLLLLLLLYACLIDIHTYPCVHM